MRKSGVSVQCGIIGKEVHPFRKFKLARSRLSVQEVLKKCRSSKQHRSVQLTLCKWANLHMKWAGSPKKFALPSPSRVQLILAFALHCTSHSDCTSLALPYRGYLKFARGLKTTGKKSPPKGRLQVPPWKGTTRRVCLKCVLEWVLQISFLGFLQISPHRQKTDRLWAFPVKFHYT